MTGPAFNRSVALVVDRVVRRVPDETRDLFGMHGALGPREAASEALCRLEGVLADALDDEDVAAALDRAIAQLVGVRARLDVDAAKEGRSDGR